MNVADTIDLLTCCTLKIAMPFSLRKLKPRFVSEMNLREAFRQEQILLITPYFCVVEAIGLDLICGAMPDEINWMWQWWMAFVKTTVERFITNHHINLFAISVHLRFRRCFLSTQFKGKICQFVGSCLLLRAVAFWCPQGTYFFQVYSLACQMSLLFCQSLL